MGFAPGCIIDLCDERLNVWQDLSQGEFYRGLAWVTDGTNTITWVEDPTVAAGTGRQVMLCTKTSNAAGAAQQVGFMSEVKMNRHNVESSDATNRTFTDLIVTTRFCWSKAVSTAAWTGLLLILPRLMDAGTNVLRVGLGTRLGEIAYILGTGSTVVTTGTAVAEGTWARLTARYRTSTGSDGLLQIWVDDTLVVNVTDHAVTSNAVASTNSLGFDHQITGTVNAAHVPILIYHSDIGVEQALQWTDVWSATPSTFAGSGAPLAGMAFGQCQPTKVNIAFRSHPGAIRFDWIAADLDVKVEYSTASDLAGSTTTSAVDAPAADRWLADIPITGLTADTVYYYRVKVNEDGDTGDVWSGPIRQFKTAPTDGMPKIGMVHCTDQAGGPYEFAHTWVAQSVDYAIHLGDFIYNDSSDSETGPHAEKEGLIREYCMTLEDRLLQRYLHQRHLLAPLVSDHDGFEDGVNNNGGYQKGYIDVEGVNAAGTNGSQYVANALCQNAFLRGDNGERAAVARTVSAIATGVGSVVVTHDGAPCDVGDDVTFAGTNSTPVIDGTYEITAATATTVTIAETVTLAGTAGTATAPARVHVPELWNNGREVNYKFLRRAAQSRVRFAATPPANAWEDTEDFEYYDHGGGLHFLFLGSREWQDWDNTEPYNGTGSVCMYGGAFQQWVYDQIDALPSTAKLLVIFEDSPFAAVNSVDDNWDQVARNQRRELLQYLKGHLPSGCKVLFVGGDRHWREVDGPQRFKHPHVGGLATGDDYRLFVLGELICGQGSKGILGQGLTIPEMSDSTGVLFSDGGGVTLSPVCWARFNSIMQLNAPTRSMSVSFYVSDGGSVDPEPDVNDVAPTDSGSTQSRLRSHLSKRRSMIGV